MISCYKLLNTGSLYQTSSNIVQSFQTRPFFRILWSIFERFFFLFTTDFIKHPQTSYNYFKFVPFFVFFDLYSPYSRDFFSFYNRLYQTSSNIIQLLQTRPFFRILWSILHIRENFFFLQETNFIKHPQTSYNCFKFIFFFSILDPFPMFERILSITGARQEGLVVLN